ncbi:S66 peptidase family protein [Peterkaempfera bronchialis]|uniref:LD-carboxypeptidase n=1 Tax=Peterkaempfera bronchialis TaxID=2126346 RepID=A0A345T225_9ACTN|nr:LD-carboxypeptidase [Peterkaempfera bronchialis]AXI80030.1 LD-carboxypeptidase [Peterkaempfera bronchialis]
MNRPVRPLVRPRRLVPGDRVAVVAPSGTVPADRLELGCGILRSWGLEVEVAPQVPASEPTLRYLAGADADRARDLERAWLDPGIAAVVCARGGYGVQRMVDLLDWEAMRAVPPKAFIGYSDITVLHEAFAVRLGLATLHGPMAASLTFVKDVPTAEHLRRTLLEPDTVRTLTSATAGTLLPGRAHGITAGGCLSLLAAERGTPHARPSFAGAILLLEDVGEDLYRLDRLLTQLLRSGALDGVAGIALGSWAECRPADRIRDLMLDRLGPLGVPVVWELGFGHGPTTLTVPLGVPAVLDADAATLTLDVPALAG